MNYLKKFQQNWQTFLTKILEITRLLVPEKISDDEVIVRGIFSPYHYSTTNSELKEGAFLPPANKKEVSVLRRNFTSDTFCKKHCSSINISGGKYQGLAAFRVEKFNAIVSQNGLAKTIFLQTSPLKKDHKTLNQKRPICKQMESSVWRQSPSPKPSPWQRTKKEEQARVYSL